MLIHHLRTVDIRAQNDLIRAVNGQRVPMFIVILLFLVGKSIQVCMINIVMRDYNKDQIKKNIV